MEKGEVVITLSNTESVDLCLDCYSGLIKYISDRYN